MNAKGKTSSKESKTQTSTPALMRWAGASAIAAGLCFVVIGMFHPENVPSAVTTATWVNAHIAATALGFFGLLVPAEYGGVDVSAACFIGELAIAAGDIECDVDLAGRLPVQVHRQCCDILLRTLREGTSG